MRILHINDYALPLGGAETYLSALIRTQTNNGDEIRLLASDSRGGGTLEIYKQESDYIVDEPILAKGTSTSSQAMRAGKQFLNRSALQAAKKALNEFRPDLVHVHLYLGQLSPIVLRPFIGAGLPLVHTSHNYRVACPKGDRLLPGNHFCEQLTGITCIKNCSGFSYSHMRARDVVYGKPQSAFSTVIAPGSAMKRILELEGFPRVDLVPNASTFTRKDFVARRAELLNLLYVGRLTSNKGVEFLIKAFQVIEKQFPGAKLNIVGDGPARAELEKMAADLLSDSTFEFHGTIGLDAIRLLQDQSRIQCVPSVWPENSPIVVYEALTAGIPIVASNIGGIPDLVRNDKDGILVKAASVADLAEGLVRIYSDDEKCLAMSRSAYEHAEAFTMERHVQKLDSIYRRYVPV